MLTGDAADNIKGLFRVGPVKAAKIIGDTTDELELYNKVLEAYEGDAERVLENAQLLFLRRYEGQIWTPPQT
jgi:5'-3' exonuclease